LLWLSAGLVLLLVAAPAPAQRITGQITGTVQDESGAALPGVVISLSGPAVVGTQTAATNNNGLYRFLALPPGNYDLAFALDGFQPKTVTGVVVSVGATSVEDVTLTVGAVTESITVVGEAPVVDTESNEVGTNYNREWVESAPVQRLSFNDLVAAAPGSLRAGDESARTMVYGSSYDENSFQLDGVDVNDNFFNEQLAEPNIDAIQEIEVLSLGAPAEYGNLTGAVYNVVTRQGGNEFHGDVNFFLQAADLTDDNTSDEQDGGFDFERDRYQDFTAQLGGPILRDRLWFFASYQRQRNGFSNAGVDPAVGTLVEEDDRYFAKLNIQLNQSHRLVATFNQDEAVEPFALNQGEDPSTQVTRRRKTPTPGLGYTGVLTDRTYLEVRYGGFYGDVTLAPTDPSLPRDQTRFVDLDTGFISGGHYYFYDLQPERTTLNAKVSHLADDFLGGSHDFRFGVQYNESQAGGVYGYNDLVFTYSVGGVQYGYGYTRVPFSYSGNTEAIGVFADDTFRVNERLTVNAGVRYDSNKAFSEAQQELDADGRPTGRTFPEVEHYTWEYISPRFGVNYQLTRDGRTILKAHAGRYHRAIATGEFANVIGPSIKPVFFGSSYDFAAGTLLDLVQITDNSNLLVDPDYRSPRTDQFIVSVEREATRQIGLNLNLVYKRGRDFAAWQDIGGLYEEAIYIDDQGAGATGLPIPLLRLLNDRSDLSFVITNRPQMDTDIYAASFGLVKRMSNNWYLNSSITWLRSEGRTPDSGGPTSLEQRGGLQFRVFGRDPNDFVNSGGRLRGDIPIQFKSQFIYLFPKDFKLAVNFAHRDGANKARLLRLGAVTNLNTQILAQERGTFGRLPSATFLDLRAEKTFRLPNDMEVALLVDGFNLLNDDAHEGIVSSLGTSSSFDVPDNFILPRRFMVGAKFRF
jgi:outer membrane receptor protein involved in Fe transport